MMLLRKLPALLLVLCLLAGEALAGGAGGAACCARLAADRPCCTMSGMSGMSGHAGAACALHTGARACALRPAGGALAIPHLHPELSLRPAVAPRPATAPLPGLAAGLPAPDLSSPTSPDAGPETPPPRSSFSLPIV